MTHPLNRFEIRLPNELQVAIDAWRGRQPNPPPRAAAVRALIELALPGDFGDGAARTFAEGNGTAAVPEAQLRRGMPWHAKAPTHEQQLGVRIDSRLMAQLDWLSREGGLTKRAAVEAALEMFLGRELRRRGVAP
ncbi:hypothetical protein GCM10011504_56570 [Siccirubricoccus deserti]|uniref:Uncharacterized protein n=1 Tax=Siccirubricoccus deserti TaxID=2013562 RepID=A0A9X0R3F2_9PROT|nr:hypothetical protein [Siccirubricoccus deserti]MBC4019146.1 hypothetical protein [Siccirubricoccus deserti]GGC71587.1 hypothetical protein GCM10011504_56570 [Siccirubricoccus deserti]